MFLRKHKMLLKQLFWYAFLGFRGFPKKHHSFPFFSGFSSSKSEFTRLFRAFQGFSVGKGVCYKGTNKTVRKNDQNNKKTRIFFGNLNKRSRIHMCVAHNQIFGAIRQIDE